MNSRLAPCPPFKVYGINLVVRMLREPPDSLTIHCPRGASIRYGQVVIAGDGFDEGSNSFREMPPLEAIVAFEEASEGVEGHYFYRHNEEYRVLSLDSIIIAFPQP
ncbi:MAG: hypothetical protein C3F08_03095 [Candidatus Methylomirabilota bacterium]|nr:MAG: hypothetical protein C3F08_03095 [candidate division NC10 bacterium]